MTQFKCPTPDCPGDARYSAPGRRHIEGCTYPRIEDGVPQPLMKYHTQRLVVAQEGVPMKDGRLILPGAIYMHDDRVPVTFAIDLTETLGYADNFNRKQNGDLEFDITIDDSFEFEWLDFSLYCTPCLFEDQQGRIIESGGVRAITAVLSRGFPNRVMDVEL